MISVIICTYKRRGPLAELLNCLSRQTHPEYEVLVVDGSEDESVESPADRAIRRPGVWPEGRLRLIRSDRGLTRQRNAGLRAARGDVICFLDDDVTFDRDFLARVSALLLDPDMVGVGGICGYDVLHFPSPISLRWRVRRLLATVPSLRPGDADHLGRNVPISFLRPDAGPSPVRWLPGFCQIYRRSAMGDLRFDESLPTYGGEDRDFSMEVGRNWQLLACPHLTIRHHVAGESRASDPDRMWQAGFGMGRSFAKRRRSAWDDLTIARSMAGEFLVDLFATLKRSPAAGLGLALARQRGMLAGLRSLGDHPGRRKPWKAGGRCVPPGASGPMSRALIPLDLRDEMGQVQHDR